MSQGIDYGTTELEVQFLRRPYRFACGLFDEYWIIVKQFKDNVYTVKSLLKKRGKDEFLVEWHNFPKSEATWEKSKNIPEFIIKVHVNEL